MCREKKSTCCANSSSLYLSSAHSSAQRTKALQNAVFNATTYGLQADAAMLKGKECSSLMLLFLNDYHEHETSLTPVSCKTPRDHCTVEKKKKEHQLEKRLSLRLRPPCTSNRAEDKKQHAISGKSPFDTNPHTLHQKDERRENQSKVSKRTKKNSNCKKEGTKRRQ